MHLHELDTDPTDDCKVCIVLKNFQSADIAPFVWKLTHLDIYFNVVDLKLYHLILSLNKGYYSTAPPHSSFI